MSSITYQGCAGSATLLVNFQDHDGPPGGRIEPATPFDLWRANYVPLDDELRELLEEIAFNTAESEDERIALAGRAEALIERYTEGPEIAQDQANA